MQEVKDIIRCNLNILFIGFNPGLRSAETGHHFAGHSNRFWKLLAESGLTPCQLRPAEQCRLLEFGYGITNIVARPSRTAAEIKKTEYRHGQQILKEKLMFYQPRIACYTGIGVYREFAGVPSVGRRLQPASVIDGVADFVVSSPSGLNRILFQEQLDDFHELARLSGQLNRTG